MTAGGESPPPPPRGWTRHQVDILRERYPSLGARRTGELIGKSARSVAQMAVKLRVGSGRTGRGMRWTARQLEILGDCWQAMSRQELTSALAPHPWYEILRRAKSLGMPNGVPRGLETVQASARRTGYDYNTLRRLLARQGVRPRWLACHSRAALYDPLAVDEAVARDLATESLQHAAQRLGVGAERLANLAREWGVRVRGGARCRLDPRQADAMGEVLRDRREQSVRARLRLATEARRRACAVRRGEAIAPAAEPLRSMPPRKKTTPTSSLRHRPWSEGEMATLAERYGKQSAEEIARALPGRSRAAIFQKAKLLGLSKSIRSERTFGRPAQVDPGSGMTIAETCASLGITRQSLWKRRTGRVKSLRPEAEVGRGAAATSTPARTPRSLQHPPTLERASEDRADGA